MSIVNHRSVLNLHSTCTWPVVQYVQRGFRLNIEIIIYCGVTLIYFSVGVNYPFTFGTAYDATVFHFYFSIFGCFSTSDLLVTYLYFCTLKKHIQYALTPHLLICLILINWQGFSAPIVNSIRRPIHELLASLQSLAKTWSDLIIYPSIFYYQRSNKINLTVGSIGGLINWSAPPRL